MKGQMVTDGHGATERVADIELLRLHLEYNLLNVEDAKELATAVYLGAFPPHGGVDGGEEEFVAGIERLS